MPRTGSGTHGRKKGKKEQTERRKKSGSRMETRMLRKETMTTYFVPDAILRCLLM